MNDKILVVEDEPDILALVSYHLEQSGFAVVPAEDEEQALSAVEQNQVCLVVLDLMLPGIGGFGGLPPPQAKPPHQRHTGLDADGTRRRDRPHRRLGVGGG